VIAQSESPTAGVIAMTGDPPVNDFGAPTPAGSSALPDYLTDGEVAATEANGTEHTFTCRIAGPGTTGYTIGIAGRGANALYAPWQPGKDRNRTHVRRRGVDCGAAWIH
jgi:hypothetical protein